MKKINKLLFEKLAYDNLKPSNNKKMSKTTAAKDAAASMSMFIFAGADLNAAAYHLNKSLELPNSEGIYVRELFVQESIQLEFFGIVEKLLRPYTNKLERNAELLSEIAQIKPKIIKAQNVTENSQTPLIIFNLNMQPMDDGVVIANVFRTTKEAISLCAKRNLPAAAKVTIWHENHSCAYEIVVALKRELFFINCFNEPPPAIDVKSSKSYAMIENNLHFEMLENDGINKTIIFPIGTIYAN